MGNEIIINIISKYGKMERMRLNKYTKGPAAGLLNGTKNFQVTVGGRSLTFLYAGQRKTCYKCGHEGHLTIDCHTEEVDKVNINNEEEFPVIQLSGEIHSSRAGVKEGEESVTIQKVPYTQIVSENAVQETCTRCEAEIHTERNNVDQTKGKISCENLEYDKADDMEATNMTGTECEVARGENMDRMGEIVELEINDSEDENQVKVKTDGGTNGDISKISGKKDLTKQNKKNENQSDLSDQTENVLECGKGRKEDGKKMNQIGK
ncbi:hypothetical protein Hamer_G003969, partial [Homarus americanus]